MEGKNKKTPNKEFYVDVKFIVTRRFHLSAENLEAAKIRALAYSNDDPRHYIENGTIKSIELVEP